MQLGMIGLGRMGGNMVLRLLRYGHSLVAYDRDQKRTAEFDAAEKSKSDKAGSVADLVKALKPPRAVWVMLPAGKITEDCVRELAGLLSSGDTIIDGGNTMFKDDVRRAQELKPKGITYMDVGTSGGVWGLERGYCLMIGGDRAAFERLEPIFAALAPGADEPKTKSPAERGYLHCGEAGAGHFVKMVHNGIEYGIMQAYAEGFEILEKVGSDKVPDPNRRFNLDLPAIAEVWRHGSVIGSWLLDLLALAMAKDSRLDHFYGYVPDSGEGRWTIEAAIEEDVPATVLSHSLFARFRSRQHPAFADKVLSALRSGFGGHKELPETAEADARHSYEDWKKAFSKK
jgi:6-phosphogluconate dehydrogenase